VLGTYMVWHARRLALCTRHFQHRSEPTDLIDAAQQPSHLTHCPIQQLRGDAAALQRLTASHRPNEVAAAAAAGGHQHPEE